MDNNDFYEKRMCYDDTIRVNDALIEEVFCLDNHNGYIIISYTEQGIDGSINVQNVRLNVDRNTIILDTMGENTCVCSLRKGMRVSAVFSAVMTRSIPPQSNAYLIVVQRIPQNIYSTTIGRVAYVDTVNNFLYTGNPNDINTQIRFYITEETVIKDVSGRDISLNQLSRGQVVRVIHANFMTASIPPQTTAFEVNVL